MIMTRDEMMNLMQNPKIATSSLDFASNNNVTDEGQLLDSDKKPLNINARVDENGRFKYYPKKA